MDWNALVLHDGDHIEAWGRLVRDESGSFFEAPTVSLAILTPAVAPPDKGSAFPVVGADFDAVERRKEYDGRVEGFATLTGRWLDGVIQVDSQTPTQTQPPPLEARPHPARSRFSRAQLDAAREVIDRHWSDWTIWTYGESADEQGQPVIIVESVLVPPEFAAWLGEQPDGLIDLRVWLVPQ